MSFEHFPIMPQRNPKEELVAYSKEFDEKFSLAKTAKEKENLMMDREADLKMIGVRDLQKETEYYQEIVKSDDFDKLDEVSQLFYESASEAAMSDSEELEDDIDKIQDRISKEDAFVKIQELLTEFVFQDPEFLTEEEREELNNYFEDAKKEILGPEFWRIIKERAAGIKLRLPTSKQVLFTTCLFAIGLSSVHGALQEIVTPPVDSLDYDADLEKTPGVGSSIDTLVRDGVKYNVIAGDAGVILLENSETGEVERLFGKKFNIKALGWTEFGDFEGVSVSPNGEKIAILNEKCNAVIVVDLQGEIEQILIPRGLRSSEYKDKRVEDYTLLDQEAENWDNFLKEQGLDANDPRIIECLPSYYAKAETAFQAEKWLKEKPEEGRRSVDTSEGLTWVTGEEGESASIALISQKGYGEKKDGKCKKNKTDIDTQGGVEVEENNQEEYKENRIDIISLTEDGGYEVKTIKYKQELVSATELKEYKGDLYVLERQSLKIKKGKVKREGRVLLRRVDGDGEATTVFDLKDYPEIREKVGDDCKIEGFDIVESENGEAKAVFAVDSDEGGGYQTFEVDLKL